MNKKERRLALSTALHSAAGSTVTVRSLKVTTCARMIQHSDASHHPPQHSCACHNVTLRA